MPPFVRTLVQLLIGFPGFMIWVYGCLFAVGSIVSLLGASARRDRLEDLWMFCGCFAVAQIGHAMHLASGILVGDPRLQFVGYHVGKLVAWSALVQVTGVLMLAAGVATLVSLGHWSRFALLLSLFGASVWVFRHLYGKRRDLYFLWVKEAATREVERARTELDAQGMEESSNPGKP